MLVSNGNGHKSFAFIHIQKTGGSSMEAFLCATVPDIERYGPRHMGARHARRVLDNWSDYYSFAFVRNPWDRLVSWYSMVDDWRRWRAAGTLRTGRCRQLDNNPLLRQAAAVSTFEAFIKDCTEEFVNQGVLYSFARNQVDYLTGPKGRLLVDFVGRFENIEQDARRVLSEIGIEGELPHANKSERGDYRHYYTPETRDIVAERFAKDIERFGYEF